MFNYILLVYACIVTLQWDLFVYCNSTAGLNVTLQPSTSDVILTGVASTNTITKATVFTHFDAILTNSAIDSVTLQPTNNISHSMISQFNSDTSHLTISHSATNQFVSSGLVQQPANSVTENEIVPTKTLVSDTLTEKSKLNSELSPLILKSENSFISSVAVNSNLNNFVTSTNMDENVMQTVTASLSHDSNILTASQSIVYPLTTTILSPSGVDLIPSSASSVVMVTAGRTSELNIPDISHSSTFDFTAKSSNILSSDGGAENSQSIATSANIAQATTESSFTTSLYQNIMSSIVSGEITPSKSVSYVDENSQIKSTAVAETSTFEQTSQVSSFFQSAVNTEIKLQSSSIVKVDSTSIVFMSEPSSTLSLSLSSVDISGSMALSVQPTIILTETAQETVITSTISSQRDDSTVILPSITDLISQTIFPGTISGESRQASSSYNTQNLLTSFTSTMSDIGLTNTAMTNIQSFTDITPTGSAVSPSLTSDINTSRNSVELDNSLFMMTTPQTSISQFETQFLFSSDLGMITSKPVTFEPTSHFVVHTLSPTSASITNPQTNISVIETQSILTSRFVITSSVVVSEQSTPGPTSLFTKQTLFSMSSETKMPEITTNMFSTLEITPSLVVNESSTPYVEASYATPQLNTSILMPVLSSSSPLIHTQSEIQLITSSEEVNGTLKMPTSTSSYIYNMSTPTFYSSSMTVSQVMNSSLSQIPMTMSNALDLSSVLVSLDSTLTAFTSFQTQNFTDIVMTPTVSSESLVSSTVTHDLSLPTGSTIVTSTDTLYSKLNYSSSSNVSSLTSDLLMTSGMSDSPSIMITATTGFPSMGLNFSTSSLPIQTLFTFNLTTQPISTVDLQTLVKTDLFTNSSIQQTPFESRSILNFSTSEIRSELTTVFQTGSESLSSLLTTLFLNATPGSIVEFSSSEIMDTTIQMTVATVPSTVISSSQVMSSSFTESTVVLTTPSSVMSPQGMSSTLMETPLNFTVISTPSTGFIMSSQEVDQSSLSIATMISDFTTTFSGQNSTVMMDSMTATSQMILPSTVLTSSTGYLSVISSSILKSNILTPSLSSSDIQSSVSLENRTSLELETTLALHTSTTGLTLTSSEVITSNVFQSSANISPSISLVSSQSINASETVSASQSASLSSAVSSKPTAMSSKIEPTTASTEMLSTVMLTTTTQGPSTSQPVTSPSTSVSPSTPLLTTEITTLSVVEMSSFVSMTTVTPTSVTATSSSTTPTTTTTLPTTTSTTPTTTTPTTTTTTQTTTTPDVKATRWVKTGITVPVNEDVTTTTFKVKIEGGLAGAYDLAFQRQQQAGRRRRKRFVQVGQAGINVTEVTRTTGTSDVTVAYTVDKDGLPLSASDALAATSTISDQMMAIKLGYEVTSKAESYVTSQPTPDEDPSSWWIVGVVLGSIAFIVIVIWIVVCIIYCKNKRSPGAKTMESADEPPLLRMKTPTGEDEDEGQQYDRVSDQDANGTSAYKVTSPKKQKYKINQGDDVYAEVKKPKRPGSSKSSDKTRSDGESVKVISEDGEKPKKKKTKKPKRSSKGVAGIEDPEENTPQLIRSTHLKGYEPQIDEDLQESKVAERKKNKQRLREKRKKKEKDQEAMEHYESGQKEIDAILGEQHSDEIPDVFIHKPKRKKESKIKEGVQNEGYVEDESLREARKRMHQLLDDAFSLISPTGSTSGDDGIRSGRSKSPLRKFTQRNKVSPEENGQMKDGDGFSSDNNSVFEFNVSTDSKQSISSRDGLSPVIPDKKYIFEFKSDGKLDTGKKHEPMQVQTTYQPLPEALQTWSPYRAADQAALISMPHSMQTSLGRDPNRKIPGKRPVANLTYSGPSLTKESPKPIILRTRELQKGSDHNRSTTLNDIGSTNSSSLSGLKSSKIGKGRDEPHQSLEMKNLNGQLSHSKPHRPPSKTSSDMDVTDVVSTGVYNKNDNPEQTLQSIRDELRSIVNSSKSPSKTRHSLADIS